MSAGELIRTSRTRAGLSLRALADRAGTSHATLAAYEHGRVTPRYDTLQRIIAAAGFALDSSMTRRHRDGSTPATTRGDELEAVLDLAGEFPARRRRKLAYPVFARTN